MNIEEAVQCDALAELARVAPLQIESGKAMLMRESFGPSVDYLTLRRVTYSAYVILGGGVGPRRRLAVEMEWVRLKL